MKMPEWISIAVQEPKEGQIVITYHEDTGIDIMKCHIIDNEYGRISFASCMGFLTDDVTHWIPIGKTMQKRISEKGYA